MQALLLSPAAARAGDFALKIESGLALPLGNPQFRAFDGGGGQNLKALFGLERNFDAGPAASLVVLPVAGRAGSGTAWAVGPSARLKRPRDLPGGVKNYGASPWLDMEALYVRTGPLNRFGVAVAIGASVAVGKERAFWLGGYARYLQIVQFPGEGFDDTDAKILMLGITLEVGAGAAHAPTVEACPVIEDSPILASQTAKPEPEFDVCPESYPDRDGDTVPDVIDRCLEKPGPVESGGCPVAQKLVATIQQEPAPKVQQEPAAKVRRLVLDQKIIFRPNRARIERTQHPVLDSVVQALKEHEIFHVQIEGHCLGVGSERHNRNLSQKRADAVLEYLLAHGVTNERLVAKGLMASAAAAKRARGAGADADAASNDRRVDFVILSDGVVK